MKQARSRPMTKAEKRERRKQWHRTIARWKREKIDRTAFRMGTLDDEEPTPQVDMTVDERMEQMMKLRWLNYGPKALYGRLERVLAFGKLPPTAVSRSRRRRR